MSYYNRKLSLLKISATTENGTELVPSTSGSYEVIVNLNETFKDLGVLTTLDEEEIDILSNNNPSVTNQTLPVSDKNIKTNIDSNFIETREPTAFTTPFPTTFMTGETESRLEEVKDFGGGFIQFNLSTEKGVISQNQNSISYAINGVLLTTDITTNKTTYVFPVNSYQVGINPIDYFIENNFVPPFIKEEELLFLSENPKVNSNIFIDRNEESVLTRINNLSTAKNIFEIEIQEDN